MKNEKGFFLVSTYLILSLLGTFSLAVFLRSVTNQRTVERTVNQIRAFHIAESGLDQALVDFRKNSGYKGQGYTLVGDKGGYEVAVTSPDPLLNPKMRQITATGHVPVNSSSAYAYAQRQVVANVEVNPMNPCTFSHAIFGDKHIDLRGNSWVDSFHSGKGPYRRKGSGANAVVATSATKEGAIELKGNAWIQADVYVGVGGDPNQVIRKQGNVNISGTIKAQDSPRNCPAPSFPEAITSSGRLNLEGNDKLTLPGGTYLFEGIKISGNGKLKLLGPATLYVKGDVRIAGNGIATAGGLAQNLVIKLPDSHDVRLEGNAKLTGVIQAPKSNVKMRGNGEITGAVEALHFHTHGNAKIHYDEALKNVGTGTASKGEVTLRSWQET